MEFRHAYQIERAPSLCKAMVMSRGSISTDPRDIIFALLGICNDGQELVPTPNYQQSVKVIVGDISRALLRRKKYVEIVLVNQLTDAGSNLATPPSWFPSGFAADLSEDTYACVNKQLAIWGEVRIPDIVVRDYDVLEVLGCTIGTITTATSTTDEKGISKGNQSQSSEQIQAPGPSAPSIAYYRSDSETVAALFCCLTTREKLTFNHGKGKSLLYTRSPLKDPTLDDRMRRHIVWHSFCLYLAGRNITRLGMFWWPFECWWLSSRKVACHRDDPELAKEQDLVTQRLLVEWFETNAKLMVQGRALRDWVKEGTFWGLLTRLLDSPLGLILACVTLWFELGFVFMFQHVIRISQGRFIAICMSLIVIGVPKLFLFVGYRAKAFHTLGMIWRNMPGVLKTPKRLICSDKGFIGMTSSEAQPGDKICFLAGRTDPLVLREVRRGNRVQHTVVGEAYVYLSGWDQHVYSGFIDQETDEKLTFDINRSLRSRSISRAPLTWATGAKTPWLVTAMGRRKCVERYRNEGMLERYELI
jgi:hypothetical protein